MKGRKAKGGKGRYDAVRHGPGKLGQSTARKGFVR